jgi:hypothetical protein
MGCRRSLRWRGGKVPQALRTAPRKFGTLSRRQLAVRVSCADDIDRAAHLKLSCTHGTHAVPYLRRAMTARTRTRARRAPLLALLVSSIAVVATFGGTLDNGFVGDDRYLLERMPTDGPTTSWRAILLGPWGGTHATSFERRMNRGYYRPVSTALLRLERVLFGAEAFGYHAVGLGLHLVCAVLVLLIALRWLTPVGATAAALLFALHAVQTEAVNAIHYQTTLLSSALVLLAIWIHAATAAEGSGSPRRGRAAVVVVVLFAAAVLAKESAIFLPLGLALLDVLLLRRPLRSILSGYFGALGAVALAYVGLRLFLLDSQGFTYFVEESAWQRLLTMLRVVGLYLRLSIWPHPLCPFYEWNVLPASSFVGIDELVAAAVVLGYIGLAVAATQRARSGDEQSVGPRLVAFALWFAPITLLPVLQIIPILNVAAERFLYLTLLSWALLFGLAVQLALESERRVVRLGLGVAFGAYLALLSALSIARNADWQSDESLSRATIASFPQSDSARVRLILTLLEQHRWDEARREAGVAKQRRPQVEVFQRLYRRAERQLRSPR